MNIDYDYLHNALDRVEHISTIDAFYRQFQAIQSLLSFIHPEIPEIYFASRFVYGLQADYQNFIFRFKPITVLASYRLASIYEESIYQYYFPESECDLVYDNSLVNPIVESVVAAGGNVSRFVEESMDLSQGKCAHSSLTSVDKDSVESVIVAKVAVEAPTSISVVDNNLGSARSNIVIQQPDSSLESRMQLSNVLPSYIQSDDKIQSSSANKSVFTGNQIHVSSEVGSQGYFSWEPGPIRFCSGILVFKVRHYFYDTVKHILCLGEEAYGSTQIIGHNSLMEGTNTASFQFPWEPGPMTFQWQINNVGHYRRSDQVPPYKGFDKVFTLVAKEGWSTYSPDNAVEHFSIVSLCNKNCLSVCKWELRSINLQSLFAVKGKELTSVAQGCVEFLADKSHNSKLFVLPLDPYPYGLRSGWNFDPGISHVELCALERKISWEPGCFNLKLQILTKSPLGLMSYKSMSVFVQGDDYMCSATSPGADLLRSIVEDELIVVAENSALICVPLKVLCLLQYESHEGVHKYLLQFQGAISLVCHEQFAVSHLIETTKEGSDLFDASRIIFPDSELASASWSPLHWKSGHIFMLVILAGFLRDPEGQSSDVCFQLSDSTLGTEVNPGFLLESDCLFIQGIYMLYYEVWELSSFAIVCFDFSIAHISSLPRMLFLMIASHSSSCTSKETRSCFLQLTANPVRGGFGPVNIHSSTLAQTNLETNTVENLVSTSLSATPRYKVILLQKNPVAPCSMLGNLGPPTKLVHNYIPSKMRGTLDFSRLNDCLPGVTTQFLWHWDSGTWTLQLHLDSMWSYIGGKCQCTGTILLPQKCQSGVHSQVLCDLTGNGSSIGDVDVYIWVILMTGNSHMDNFLVFFVDECFKMAVDRKSVLKSTCTITMVFDIQFCLCFDPGIFWIIGFGRELSQIFVHQSLKRVMFTVVQHYTTLDSISHCLSLDLILASGEYLCSTKLSQGTGMVTLPFRGMILWLIAWNMFLLVRHFQSGSIRTQNSVISATQGLTRLLFISFSLVHTHNIVGVMVDVEGIYLSLHETIKDFVAQRITRHHILVTHSIMPCITSLFTAHMLWKIAWSSLPITFLYTFTPANLFEGHWWTLYVDWGIAQDLKDGVHGEPHVAVSDPTYLLSPYTLWWQYLEYSNIGIREKSSFCDSTVWEMLLLGANTLVGFLWRIAWTSFVCSQICVSS